MASTGVQFKYGVKRRKTRIDPSKVKKQLSPRQLQKYQKLSKMVLQNVSLNVNNNFTKTEYKSFYLKKKVWEAIRIGHNWTKRGSISRFAEALGITRQYASLIVSGKAGCSAFVMRKIVNLMNLHNACWCFMFEQARCDDVDPNHPVLNSLKEAGEVPYSHYSESAALRSQDYETERNPI